MKWINKTSLRKIRVDNEVYLWKRGHYHLEEFVHSKCVEKVIIFLDGYKNSPLHLLFREEDNLLFKSDLEKEKWCVGYPDAGVIWLYKQEEDIKPQLHDEINLNRPAVIAQLIQHYVKNYWEPRISKKPLIIDDALCFIERLDLPKGLIGVNEKR